jgi:hypothetical protein
MWAMSGRKRPTNQVRRAEVTNSIETPTPTSDSPVAASTTRFMDSSDSIKLIITEMPSVQRLANNQFPSHEVARASSKGALR